MEKSFTTHKKKEKQQEKVENKIKVIKVCTAKGKRK